MRLRSLAALALVGGCSTYDGLPHAGDSNYVYNYVYPPPAPQLDSLVAGDRKITVYFTPGGGSNFAAVCTIVSNGTYGNTGNAQKSPAPVENLQNNVEYRCNVTAFNGGRPSPSSSYLNATPKAP